MNPKNMLSLTIGLLAFSFVPVLNAQYRELTGGEDLPDKYERQTDTAVQEYNNHYFTNFSNTTEIQQDMISKINAYYSNLRTCTPGNYHYSMYDMSESPYQYQTATIRGYNQGECVVEIREDNQDVIDEKKPYTTCNISPQKLQSFTNQYGESLITEGPTVDAQNKVNLTELNQCETYESGRPQEIEKEEPHEVTTRKPVKYYQGDLEKNYPENDTDRANEQNF